MGVTCGLTDRSVSSVGGPAPGKYLLLLARCRALTNHNFSELAENIGDALRQLRLTRAAHVYIDSGNVQATANCVSASGLIDRP